MDCYEARLESFKKTKRVKTKGGTVVLKWPHPNTYLATPEQLAEAGFYFNPTPEARDSVRCFMCKKELDMWDEDDDPISLHFARCRDICAWAVARCGNMEDLDESGGFTFKDPSRAPTSKTMEKARYDTFASSWPHDGIRGHGASSKRMAKAGFLHAPHSSGDDTAICVYCTTTLAGWDKDDDPLEEHRKRVSKSGKRCAFFEMLEGSSRQVQPSRANKASSRYAHDDPSSDELSELTILTTAKTKRTTRASSVPAKTPASRRSARSTGTSGRMKATNASETEEDMEPSGSDTGKRVSKSKKKGVKKANDKIEAIVEVDEDDNMGAVEEVPEVQKPKRGRPPGKAKAKKVAESAPDDLEVEPSFKKPAHTRTRSRPNVDSDSEPAPSTKPPSSQPKLKSSTKARKVEKIAPESEASQESAIAKQPDDAELMPPPKSRSKAKAAAVIRSTAIEIESDEEDALVILPQAMVSKKLTKKNPSNRPVDDKLLGIFPPPDLPVSQGKGRKSSSTSDDAGYATAEQAMEVDGVQDLSGHSKTYGVPLQETSERQTLVTRETLQTDVVMEDVSESARDSRLAYDSKSIHSDPKLEPVKPQIRPSSRATGSLARPPSRIGTEIVDISSDDDDELDVLRAIVGEKPSGTSSITSGSMPSKSSVMRSSSTATLLSKVSGPSPRSVQDDALKTIAVPATKSVDRRKPALIPSPPPTVSDVAMDAAEGMLEETRVKPSSIVKLKETKVTVVERIPSPATPLPDNSSAPPSEVAAPAARALPSFDEELAAEEPSVAASALKAFTPFLSITSIHNLSSLTEEEENLTLEEYIRRQLELQYQQFKEDGDRQIAVFKQRAAETRQMIEDL
ncbi:hypothetical protein BC835DRAFT_1383935 [Cytidiella melzeri]|nr:hypothetical protein BC835DRAFT_1383935 [Cytidiella melzeri]